MAENNADTTSYTFTDDAGRNVVIPRNLHRIVSLTPSITELLYAFTDTNRIAGRSVWCDYPESVKKLPALNTYPLDIEAVARLKPDVVFAKKGMISIQELEKLERVNISVVVLKFDLITEIESSTRKLVQITHGDTLKMNAWFDKWLAPVDTTASDSVQTCIVVTSVSPIYVFGKKTYVSELIERAGGKNFIYDTDSSYPVVDVEYVLKTNPDVYIFNSTEQQTLFFEAYPVLKKTKAYKEQKIFYIGDSVLSRPGIRLPQLYQSIKSILHK
ncbi:MAG: ABC transporter substrate-binding protein [Cytophaga sp.]|uniref:ABC transporter substrate-binding protein n=1 Tax=Cytophaga sp. TaxID=29535 RepID=UPI003F7F8DEA